jgi:CheY-like chemotaxis protein
MSQLQNLGDANKKLLDNAKQTRNFLAMLSHELRNPLAPILNALQVMRMYEHARKEEILAAQEQIERQTKHMARMLDDLLDVSRITSGKIHLKLTPQNLNIIVARTVQTCRIFFTKKVQDFNMVIPDVDIWSNVDVTRFEQCLTNLLTNASKYTDAGGKITVMLLSEGPFAVIRVRDNGIGIRPDMIDSVFDTFVQSDRALDRSQGGLGLGLSIVKHLVEMHGGTVKAYSSGLGEGSEFVIRLPLGKAAEKPIPHVQDSMKGAVKVKKILVVDDNIDAADSLSTLLSLEGHEVETAYDGEEALRKAENGDAEIVLLDIGLPKMDCYSVARAIRRGKKIKTKLIALTGYGQEEDRRKSKDSGFDAHLVKPVDPKELNRYLNEI